MAARQGEAGLHVVVEVGRFFERRPGIGSMTAVAVDAQSDFTVRVHGGIGRAGAKRGLLGAGGKHEKAPAE